MIPATSPDKTPRVPSLPTPRPYADEALELPLAPSEQIATTAPGDSGSPLIGHTLEFVRDATGLVARNQARYGSCFRLQLFGYPVLEIGEPEAVKAVLMDRDKNFSSRLGWVHAVGDLFARGLMLRDFEEHRLHRSILQVAFRAEAMRRYSETMNPLIERGIDGWESRLQASGDQPFLFYPAIKQLTLDLAAEVFLGLRLGEEADELNRAFVDSVAASIALIKKEIPFLAFRRGMNGRRRLERFFSERIAERRAGRGSDIFTQLCQAESEDGERFSDQDIVDHMIFLMMAAHDTTTSSITTSIWSLAQHPAWQEKLCEESAALGCRFLDYADRDKLESADWVFREALRLYPPVPFIGRRAVRDCELAGLRVPANTGLSVCSLITHALPEIWTDPGRFDPERFSSERAEHKRHSHAWYPFGGGAHTCLGMHFAYLQVKAFLHQFLQRYRVLLREGQKVTMIPIPIPRPKEGLPLMLERID